MAETDTENEALCIHHGGLWINSKYGLCRSKTGSHCFLHTGEAVEARNGSLKRLQNFFLSCHPSSRTILSLVPPFLSYHSASRTILNTHRTRHSASTANYDFFLS